MKHRMQTMLMILVATYTLSVKVYGEVGTIPSKIAIDGHPIHPMFIVFPLGLFVATLLFDAIGLWKKDAFWSRAAYCTLVVGFIGGVVAAVFGLAEYLITIPDGNPVDADAELHGILNAVAMAFFAVNLWLRWRVKPDYQKAARVGTFLSAVGVVIMLAGAAIGGEMVFRDGVGVNLEDEDSRAPVSPLAQDSYIASAHWGNPVAVSLKHVIDETPNLIQRELG